MPSSRILLQLLVFWLSALSLRAAINAPSGLTGSWTPSQFTLSWTDNSNNESGFFITYRVGTTGSFSIYANVGANVKTYTTPSVNATGCLDVQWAIFGFAGTPANYTDTSPSSNIVTLRSPPKIISPLTYASPLGYPFSYNIRLQQCDAAGAATGYNATGLPAGLSVDTSTGLISGNPAAAGSSTVTLTATYGTPAKTVTASLNLRIYQCQRTPAAAPLVQPIPAQLLQKGSAAATFALNTWFSDPDATSAVRVSTTSGDMDFAFFGNVAPLTVANFMNYVNRGDFANTFFHRSVPGFVIQGGGFRATTPVTAVPTDPPVVNEFNPAYSNLCGTISMAKLGGNPDSATCQFFVSLDDNSANLDNQNGGFTVFGRVAGNGMATAFDIARRPIRDWQDAGVPASSALGEVPVTTPAAGDTYNAAQLVKVNSVTAIPHLTWQALSSAPAVCSASVTGGTLTLTPGNTKGTATITITATDLDGLTVQGIMAVSVEENLTTWLAAQNFTNPGDAGALADPDRDGVSNIFEFAWLHDPRQQNAPLWPALSVVTAGGSRLALTFPVRKFTGPGFRYTAYGAPSLAGPWAAVWSSTDGFTHARVSSAVDQTDRTMVTVTDSSLITPGNRRFLRVEVSQQ